MNTLCLIFLSPRRLNQTTPNEMKLAGKFVKSANKVGQVFPPDWRLNLPVIHSCAAIKRNCGLTGPEKASL